MITSTERRKRKMKRIKYLLLLTFSVLILVLSGCSGRSDDAGENSVIVVEHDDDEEETEEEEESEEESEPQEELIIVESEMVPVKAKGIYISAYVAGTDSMMDEIIGYIDETELNTIVIDLKEDFGRVVCEMDSDLINDIGSVKQYIPRAQELVQKLHDHDIYVIARVPAFRDRWLGDARPDWCCKNADGTVFHDRDGNSWVNPYKQEAWDYLVEIGKQAKKLGFDETQFDYVRFCTERGMNNVVFDEEDTQGRSKTDIILESVEYLYDQLKAEGLFVSADVFGTIIDSEVDAQSVGQIYTELAKHLDTISPMVYPSHYSDHSYGIEHPDLNPYETIRAAMDASRQALSQAARNGEHVAEVRPWLQDFTATWLTYHRSYGADEIRQQIQAVYDSGYDEWLLWDASCKYSWNGLLSPTEAEAQTVEIAESRAAKEQQEIEESLAALEAESIAESEAMEEKMRELEALEEQQRMQELESLEAEQGMIQEPLPLDDDLRKMQELEALEAQVREQAGE